MNALIWKSKQTRVCLHVIQVAFVSNICALWPRRRYLTHTESLRSSAVESSLTWDEDSSRTVLILWTRAPAWQVPWLCAAPAFRFDRPGHTGRSAGPRIRQGEEMYIAGTSCLGVARWTVIVPGPVNRLSLQVVRTSSAAQVSKVRQRRIQCARPNSAGSCPSPPSFWTCFDTVRSKHGSAMTACYSSVATVRHARCRTNWITVRQYQSQHCELCKTKQLKNAMLHWCGF